jgi:hypothetical protein
MRTEALVEALSRDCEPVRPQSMLRDAIILCVVGLVELLVFLRRG